MWIKRKNEELYAGVKIRLGGREGTIEFYEPKTDWWCIEWEEGLTSKIDIENFPSLEILKPRVTISKEAAKQLYDWIMSDEEASNTLKVILLNKIDSMTE